MENTNNTQNSEVNSVSSLRSEVNSSVDANSSSSSSSVSSPRSDSTPHHSGSNRTPRGTMTKDMMKRHKLPFNIVTDLNRADRLYHERGGNRVVKKSVQLFTTYRVLVHGVTERRLARSLVETAQFFASVNKPEYKQRDKDGTEPDMGNAAAANS